MDGRGGRRKGGWEGGEGGEGEVWYLAPSTLPLGATSL